MVRVIKQLIKVILALSVKDCAINRFICVFIGLESDKSEAIQDLRGIARWICNRCNERLAKLKAYSMSIDEYCYLHETVGKLFKIVNNVVNDNLEIN